MPIYAYRCEECGFAKDALQKISDAPLTQCPSCNKATFKKQVTAAGFQLKGTGWYVTDFRGGNGAKKAPSTEPSNGESKPSGDAAGAAATPAGASADTASSGASPAPSTSVPSTPSASS